MLTFQEFDPLEFKSSKSSEAAVNALKREIKNILSSYVGWYDPFCELIQNALDAVELRAKEEGNAGYQPLIQIIINIKDNSLTVTDNGIGLNKDQFQQFLAPNFSFKSGETRGHKGVGATYVAYGFNHMLIATRTPTFSATGHITNSRKWLSDLSPSGNPKVTPAPTDWVDGSFKDIDRGVSITVRFDETTHPRQLVWIQTSTAEAWWKILSIRTGLGAIFPNNSIKVLIRVIDKDGTETIIEKKGSLITGFTTNAIRRPSFPISRPWNANFSISMAFHLNIQTRSTTWT